MHSKARCSSRGARCDGCATRSSCSPPRPIARRLRARSRIVERSRFVPAFAGLGAPHWRPDARGAILGLTLGSTRAHIVRAALEAVANQTEELRRAFAADGVIWSHLKIDGAMSANDFLAQDIADAVDMQVERPANVETTALGAAMLAGVGCGMFGSFEEAAAARGEVATVQPGNGRRRSCGPDRALGPRGGGGAVGRLRKMVPRGGVEPPTRRFSVVCSTTELPGRTVGT